MRVLITVMIITVIIIAGWYLIYDSVRDNTDEFSYYLNDLEKSIIKEEWGTASFQFNKINDKWITIRDTWSILLEHHEIDNIDLSMAKAEKYVKSQNISIALGEIETLKKLFDIVNENQSLTLTNIF